MPHLIIAGGGAAGLAAAVTAASHGARVTLLERADRVGKKILQTGNGRCNLTNLAVSPDAYNAPAFVAPVLSALDCNAMREFFASLGLMTYADNEGRVYPVSDAASGVLDVLRLASEERGVQTVCSFDAVSLRGSTVVSADGRKVHGDAVLVATGGGTELLRSAGHTITPFSPILCPLKTDIAPLRGLSGLRAKCAVTLSRDGRSLHTMRGEVLFRDYGVSGIVIFDLSRFAKAGDALSLDLLPDIAEEELCKLLRDRRIAHPTRRGEAFLTGVFHSRIALAVLRAAGSDDPAALAHAAKALTVAVQGCGDRKQAQVTRGGAKLDEFDPATLRSRKNAQLYAAGEALDIDGACGGYNLHWAFASGIRAAECAVGGQK